MIRGIFNIVVNIFVANIPFICIRNSIYSLIFNVGKNVNIMMGVRFLSKNITIGDNSVINYGCLIDSRGSRLEIGKNVDIAPYVHIWTLEHDPESESHDVRAGCVLIEDNAWICTRVTILPGVRIGKGAVVAAGSLVINNVNDHELVAGVPAKFIKKLKSKADYTLDYKPWFY
jgi:maltose O-acetyltransferase